MLWKKGRGSRFYSLLCVILKSSINITIIQHLIDLLSSCSAQAYLAKSNFTWSLPFKVVFKICSIDTFKCHASSGHYANQWKVGTEETKVFHICFDFFKSSLYFKLLNGMHFVKILLEDFICYTKQLNFILEVMWVGHCKVVFQRFQQKVIEGLKEEIMGLERS